MSLTKPILSLFLAASLLAQQQPAPAPVPAPQQQTAKKKGGKKKWIIIGAVAAGVTVALIALNARLGNEGKGIF